MFRKVLVALDGSNGSERSLPWVRAVAPESRLILVRVKVPVYSVGTGDTGMTMAYVMQDGAEQSLAQAARRWKPVAKTVLRQGSAAGTILDVAREHGCDLIAVTTRGGWKLYRRVLGGTTEKLLHGSRRPILVVPAWIRVPRGRLRLRRIAVPLDGSEIAEKALPLAAELARRHGADLLLLHGLADLDQAREKALRHFGDRPGSRALKQIEIELDRRRGELEKHFEGLAAELRRRGTGARALLVHGMLPQSVLEAARKEKADLMVMCVHGHGALKHLLFGAMASKMIRETSMPVLAVRHDVVGRMKPARKAGARRGSAKG